MDLCGENIVMRRGIERMCVRILESDSCSKSNVELGVGVTRHEQ